MSYIEQNDGNFRTNSSRTNTSEKNRIYLNELKLQVILCIDYEIEFR